MSSAVMTGAEGAGERRSVGGPSLSQGLLGVIALVLGIVGLALAGSKTLVPIYLAAIAEIALGLSLIAGGVSLSGSYQRLLAREDTASAASGNMAGASVDMFLGGAIVILAILSILSVVAAVLIPIAIIVIGAGLVLNSAASIRLANIESSTGPSQSVSRRVAQEMVISGSSARAIAGVAVFILGILGVIAAVAAVAGKAGAAAGSHAAAAGAATTGANAAAAGSLSAAMVLALVAVLIAGAALLLNSTSLGGRVVRVMTR